MVVSQIALPVVLFLLMTIVGLDLTVADFRRVFQAPRAVIGGTLAQWIMLPFLTWGVTKLFGLSPAFAAGAILVAVSPGAGISNIAVQLGRANTALSVTLTATASMLAVFTLPTISALAMGLVLEGETPIHVPVTSLMGQLFISLVVPICSGMILRAQHPRRAGQLRPWLQRITIIVIGVAIITAAATVPEEQRNFEGSRIATVAAGVWTLSAAGAGWITAYFLRLPAADRFTFMIEFSARNIAVASIVAISGLGRTDFTFFSGVYAVAGYPTISIIVLARRILSIRKEQTAPAPSSAPAKR